MEPLPLTAAQRVARLIEELEVTPYQFGKETGLSHQTISNVLTGKNKPSLDTLEAIAARYPNTAVWLLTGKGEPRTGTGPMLRDGRALTPAPPTDPTPAAPLMRVTPVGELEGYWRAIADERQRTIDGLREDLEAWRDAYRKPPASADAAAAYFTLVGSAPIGPRFDNPHMRLVA